MNYTLFTDYITLQALLKECGIIQSGGAIKAFLAETPVFFNGEPENRRGKKLRVGDTITFNNQSITLIEPSEEEKEQYLKDKAEKERVAKLVKEMNQQNKARKPLVNQKVGIYRQKQAQTTKKKAVRFPGT